MVASLEGPLATVISDEVPKELTDACGRSPRESAETLFNIASKHYEPVVVGMLQGDVWRGGPLFGFEVKLPDGPTLVINGFAASYYGVEGRLVTEYKSIDDLLGMSFACFSGALQQVLQLGATRPWVAYGQEHQFPPMVQLS